MLWKPLLAALSVGLILFGPSVARAQAGNACDLNQDGTVDLVDVQLAISMALGTAPCNANVAGSGVCNVVVVQRVTNAVLGMGCLTGAHSVSLSWVASTSTNVAGYNIYRGTAATGPYTKVNSKPVAQTAYTDSSVQSGQTYFYVATAVDSAGNESAYSNQAPAVIPIP